MARNVKQVIVFRKDLLKGDTSIRKGKFAAQVAHASVGALMQTAWKNKFPSVNPETPDKMIHNWHFLFADTDESPLNLWLNGTFTKIVLSIDEADVVLLMIDSQIGLSDQDKKIANLIVRRGKGIIMVINKIDELDGIENEVSAIKDKIRFFFPILSFAPISAISALEGQGISAMLDTVWSVWRQLNKRISTNVINNALKDWTESYTPPRGSLGHYKVMYGTQVSVTPVRFLFFVNRLKDFPEIYEKYLKNAIRKDLGFSQIPVEISLRERKRNESLNKKGDKPLLSKYGEDLDRPKIKATAGKARAKNKKNKPGNVASLDKRIKKVRKNVKNSKGKKR